MCLRDKKSHFSRTPLEIAHRYWPDDEITKILNSSLDTYLPYRLRVCVRLCAEKLFLLPHGKSGKICNANHRAKSAVTSNTSKEATTTQTPLEAKQTLKPFDKKDRRIAGLAPRPWFVASVLGYALQREMKGLALHITSFVGCGAKLETKRRSKKKKKSRSAAATSVANTGKGSNNAIKSRDEAISNARKKRKTR
jgi:hypothetical protein